VAILSSFKSTFEQEPFILLPFLQSETAFVSNVPFKSAIPTISPALGLAGSVTVTAPEDVSTKYPMSLAAVNGLVLAVVQ